MALEPIPQYLRKAFNDFTGGLNDFDASYLVKQNQLTELENAIVNDRGMLEKAKGYSVDGSPFPDDVDSFIRMIVNYRSGTDVDKLVVAALDDGNTNSTLKVDFKETEGDGNYTYIGHTTGTASFTNGNTSVTGSGTAWTSHLKAGDKIKATAHSDSVYAEIQSVTNDTTLVLTANYTGATAAGVSYIARKIFRIERLPQGINFNDKLVITNGLDTPITYNDTTVDNITDAQCPKGRYIESHKSRVFMANTTADPSSIFWSDVNNEAAWDATAVEDVYVQDGGNIVGIKSFADSLIVFKDNGRIYQVVGSFDQDAVGEPDFIRRIDVPENMGTVAGYTPVVGNDNKLYFLAETGVYTLDSRMYIDKVSWNIDNLVSDIRIQIGAERTKTFTYDSQAQWNTGTHNGTISRSGGKLQPYFDSLTITDANQTNGCISVAIDSNKDVHIAYLIAAGTSIIYKKLLSSDNSVDVTETVASSFGSTTVYSISIDLDGTTPGVAWKRSGTGGTFVEYAKRNAGTWTGETAVTLATAGDLSAGTAGAGISLKFRSDGLPRIAACGTTSTSGGVTYAKRDSGGVWTTINYETSIPFARCALQLQSDSDPRIAATRSSSDGIHFITGSGAETTLSLSEQITPTLATNGNYHITLNKNASNVYFSAYLDSGVAKIKEWGGSVTTPLSPAPTGFPTIFGHAIDSDNEQNLYTRVDSTERFLFSNTEDVSSTSDTTTALYPSDKGMTINGSVFATIAYGASANQVIVRRLTYKGIYTSAEERDAALASWGSYDISGETSGGNTVLHEVGTAVSSPVSSFGTITNGQLISTGTNTFVQFRITFTLVGFAQAEIDSVILNYAEDEVGWFVPGGVLFDNQYYVSYSEPSDTANSTVLVYDRGGSFTTIKYPVTFMTRFRGQLYAGSATTGKVYKLLQNYSFNSSAYTMTAVTKEDFLGSLELQKEIYKIYVLFEVKNSGTIDFSYRTDNFTSSSGASWTTTTINQTQDGVAEVPYIGLPFRSIQFKVENDELDVQVGVVGFVIAYSMLGIR